MGNEKPRRVLDTPPGNGRSDQVTDMDNTTAQCSAQDGQEQCEAPSAPLSNPPICDHHRAEIALRVAIEKGPATPQLLADAVRAMVPRKGHHDRIVYFLRNGNRVKIGTTTNLAARVEQLALRMDSSLLLLYGGRRLEAALHRHFEAYRIGNTEWFNYSDRIAHYIFAMRMITPEVPGDPAAVQPSVALDGDLLESAAVHVTDYGIASATMLQRRLNIGYNRASRIIAALEAAGVCTPKHGPGNSRKPNFAPSDTAGALDAVRRFTAMNP